MPSRPPGITLSGQVLIGVIIALGIFSILSQAVIVLAFSGYKLISYTRARTTARHLASEQIELVKNLSYDQVGTVDGIPPGVIPQTEILVRNGLNYTITTAIVYFDDPFDTLAPTDTAPNDYKKITVAVSWGGLTANKAPVTLATYLSPPNEEVSSGGVLSIHVTNAQGQPVPNAQVTIIASTSPPTNATYSTDSNGLVYLPGSPSCASCYQVSAHKSDFSTDRTYGTGEVDIPVKPHATVQEGQVTELNFTIDELGSLQITSLDNFENAFAPLPNQTFRLHGEKIIGTTGSGQLVYKFDENIITDGSALATIENIEWDRYRLLAPESATRDISAVNPLLPVIIEPNQDVAVIFATTPVSDHRLFLSFTDNSGNPVSSVSAILSDGADFSETYQSSDSARVDYSQAFFDTLNEQLYYLEATSSGFLDYSSDVYVTGYMTEQVQLQPE